MQAQQLEAVLELCRCRESGLSNRARPDQSSDGWITLAVIGPLGNPKTCQLALACFSVLSRHAAKARFLTFSVFFFFFSSWKGKEEGRSSSRFVPTESRSLEVAPSPSNFRFLDPVLACRWPAFSSPRRASKQRKQRKCWFQARPFWIYSVRSAPRQLRTAEKLSDCLLPFPPVFLDMILHLSPLMPGLGDARRLLLGPRDGGWGRWGRA